MARIGELEVGPGSVPKVMGIINASPESFFKGSVKTSDEQVAEAARQMELDGADIIDIGAMSTAPYLDTLVSEEEESRRLTGAIRAARRACSLPISADTPRSAVAESAIEAGASVINDVTGLKYDGEMARVVARHGVHAIICAYSKSRVSGRISGTIGTLRKSLQIAQKAKISESRIIVDPSIGFFRSEGRNPFFTKMTDMSWYSRDIEVMSGLAGLAALKKPVCVSVSRKSFIGHLLNLQSPDDRLAPSLASEILAVQRGASLVRTHSVKETVQALAMLQMLDGPATKRL